MNDIQNLNFKEELDYGFEIIDISFLRENHLEDMIVPHRAEFYQIIWIQKGSASHIIDFEAVEIASNNIVFINKNNVQVFDASPNYNGKMILFTDDFFRKSVADSKFLGASILFNDLQSVSKIDVNNIAPILNNFIQLMQAEISNRKDNFQLDILRNYLRNFLLLAEREKLKQANSTSKNNIDLDLVISFKSMLEENYIQRMAVNEYAERLFITTKKLNKATTQILGKTPKQIIDNRMMLEAKRILAHTTDSVKQIAFDLGFEEATNFNKFFKKHHGTTPVDFRESLKISFIA